MAGSLDDVTLWDKALSAEVVSQLYKDQISSAYFCCPKSCPTGKTSNNTCTGNLNQDCVTSSSKCPSCGDNQKLSEPCTSTSTSSCLPCLPRCPPGVIPLQNCSHKNLFVSSRFVLTKIANRRTISEWRLRAYRHF
jgi:hypothetical protein